MPVSVYGFGAEVDTQGDGEVGEDVGDGVLDALALVLAEDVVRAEWAGNALGGRLIARDAGARILR